MTDKSFLYKNDKDRDVKLCWRSLELWIESAEEAIKLNKPEHALRALWFAKHKSTELAKTAYQTN